MRVKNGASACVHLLNVLYRPKLHSCQRKHLYYEVQILVLTSMTRICIQLITRSTKLSNPNKTNSDLL